MSFNPNAPRNLTFKAFGEIHRNDTIGKQCDQNSVIDCIKRGADLNFHGPLTGGRILDVAIKAGLFDVVETLIKKGMSVKGCNEDWGYTPIGMAVLFSHEKICTLLIDAGADPFEKDSFGQDAFTYLRGPREKQIKETLNKYLVEKEKAVKAALIAEAAAAPHIGTTRELHTTRIKFIKKKPAP